MNDAAMRRCSIRCRWGTAACLLGVLAAGARLAADGYEGYLREGNRLYGAGDFAGAEEKYILAQNEKPDSAAARFNAGNAYFGRRDYTRAIERYVDALNHVRADRDLEVKVRYNLATAKVRESERPLADIANPESIQKGLGLLREAIAGYRDLLEIDPGHEAARRNLAQCQLRVKLFLDTLKRLQEEAAKKQKEQQGQSPAEILEQLIAEEEAEVALSDKARELAKTRDGLAPQRARVAAALEEARRVAGGAADPPEARRDASQRLLADLQALENDPALVTGAAEVASARKALEGGASAADGLQEAEARLGKAIGEAEGAFRETIEKDKTDQQSTQAKTLGLVLGLRQAADGKSGAPPAAAAPGPGRQPPPPAAAPPPPEVAEALRRIAQHGEDAAGGMARAIAILDGAEREKVEALGEALAAQGAALEALKKALEEAKKMGPKDEPQPKDQEEQQQNQQPDSEKEKKEGEKKKDGDSKEAKKEGEQAKDKDEDPPLSEEEAEALLRRFLSKDREREKQKDQRRVRAPGGRLQVDKDW
jgi:tetratricopeptide (TPR) repeat protein